MARSTKAGMLFQWNDAIISGFSRGLLGGSFGNKYGNLWAGYRSNSDPTGVSILIGFRVSQVPEPASLAILALSVAGLMGRRRETRENTMSGTGRTV